MKDPPAPLRDWYLQNLSQHRSLCQKLTIFSLQAITSLQVSTDGGSTFADMDRRPDGFFLARGTLALSGGSTVAIKAWAGSQSVVATGVAIGGGSFEAAGNFA